MVRDGGRVRFLDISEIDWIAAAGNYVEIHAGGERHFERVSLTRFMERLDTSRFARIHRSTIVNVDRVVEMTTDDGKDFTVRLADGTELRMSRRYRAELERRYR